METIRQLELLPHREHTNYKVEEDEVGGTCGTNGGAEERV
jgi:hypothetical protein